MNNMTQSLTDGLDAIVGQLDQKWGIGRLRLLVDDQLRARFDEQHRLLSYALASGDEEAITTHTMAMKRGWLALDQAATAAGAEPLHPLVWECTLPESGEVVAIVRTEAEAQHVCRDVEVYTLAEVGQLIEKLGKGVRQIKDLYPGAAVAVIRDQPEPPLWITEEAREQHVNELAAQFDALGPDPLPF
jgi:hypothetical protein